MGSISAPKISGGVLISLEYLPSGASIHSLRGYFIYPVPRAEGNGHKSLVLLPIPWY